MNKENRRWLWQSSIFRLGMIITVILLFLLVDSFRFVTRYATVHRGSWRNYAHSSVIHSAAPESGSLAFTIFSGAIYFAWLDQLRPMASYSGGLNRYPLHQYPVEQPLTWLPKFKVEKNAFVRIQQFTMPIWLIFTAWMLVWLFALRQSYRRFSNPFETKNRR